MGLIFKNSANEYRLVFPDGVNLSPPTGLNTSTAGGQSYMAGFKEMNDDAKTGVIWARWQGEHTLWHTSGKRE